MKDKIKVAVCVDMKWKNEIFSGMGNYAKESYFHYTELSKLAKKDNIKVIRTDLKFYNKRSNTFSRGWIFDDILGWVRIVNFKADIIHNATKNLKKTEKQREHFFKQKKVALNPKELQKIVSNKLETYKHFKDFCPITFRVKDKQAFLNAVKKIPSKKIVIKPIVGSSAANVFIINKKDVPAFKLYKDALVQEFIETKGQAKDYRIIIANNRYVQSYSRIAKGKSKIVNFSFGGSMKMVKHNNLPKSVITTYKQIMAKLTKFPYNMYTIDIMIDAKGKPKLIELNGNPGAVLYRPNSCLDGLKEFQKAKLKVFRKVYELSKLN